MTTRGFVRRRRADEQQRRVPPGQYIENGFPVLSYEPTPLIEKSDWRFTIETKDGTASWDWNEMMALPQEDFPVDIHCVTKWSKLGTLWRGAFVADFLAAAGLQPQQPFVTAYCFTGYTTNLPAEDLMARKAMVAHTFDGAPLDRQHGGPARLLVPHLYFWKSAKWIKGLRFTDDDTPGFWERYGYHNRGDPWLEQRYAGD
ncbi:MAG: sulfite oxidase-like oxidoreductase [Actinomycetota bacterium]